MAAAKQLSHFWPDGKHKSWKTIPLKDRQAILGAIREGLTNEAILRHCYRNVSVGTLAAVRAALNR